MSVGFVVTLDGGRRAAGPFETYEEAAEFLSDESVSGDEDATVCEIEPPGSIK